MRPSTLRVVLASLFQKLVKSAFSSTGLLLVRAMLRKRSCASTIPSRPLLPHWRMYEDFPRRDPGAGPADRPRRPAASSRTADKSNYHGLSGPDHGLAA